MSLFYKSTPLLVTLCVPGTYLDSSGVKKFQGTNHLKASQRLRGTQYFLFFNPLLISPKCSLTDSSSPRRYPSGFGMALLNGYLKSCEGEFRRDLRKKFELDPSMSDREIFNRYPLLPDQWMDASLPDIFFYLYGCNHLVIPDSWQDSIDGFKNQLIELIVPCSS